MNKYNPNYQYIWEQQSSGPKWESKIRKNFSAVPRTPEDKKYYIAHGPVKVEGKNFLDFDRQTRRKSFNKTNNLRSILVTSGQNFNKNKRNKSMPILRNPSTPPGDESQKKDYENSDIKDEKVKNIKSEDESSTGSVRKTKNKFFSSTKSNLTGNLRLNNSFTDKKEIKSTRYGSFTTKHKRNSYCPILEMNAEEIEKEKIKKMEKQQLLNKIKAPDFAKIISRKKFMKLNEVKTNIYRYVIPNSTLTQSSIILL